MSVDGVQVFPPSAAYPPPAPDVPTEVTNPSGGVDLDASTGVHNLQKAGVTGLVVTVDPVGVNSIAPVAGATEFLLMPAQKAAGVGTKTRIGGGTGQTPGTHLAGGLDIDQGALSSGASAPTTIVAGGASSLTIRRTPSARVELESPGLAWFKGAAGAIIGANDDSVRAYFEQATGGITTICGFIENGGQYSTATNKLAIAGTMNINWALSNIAWLGALSTTKITTNVSVAAPTNGRDGNLLYGVRSVSNGVNTKTWNAIFTFGATGTNINQWAGGPPADNKVTWHWFMWDGTSYDCVLSSIR